MLAARVGKAAASAGRSVRGVRSLHVSPAAAGIEEFFAPVYARDEAGNPLRPPAGRSWRAAELRGKSFEDLHKLWWVCAKELNALLTDRLYHNQAGVEMPDASRVKKVRRTMARIKHVLWERKLVVDEAVDAAGRNPEPLPPLAGDPVLIKKFGRSIRVPSDHVWNAKPTQAARKRAWRAARHRRALQRHEELDAARRQAEEEAVPADVREWYTAREEGLTRKQSVDDSIGTTTQQDARFDSSADDLDALREAVAEEMRTAAAKRARARNVGQRRRQEEKQEERKQRRRDRKREEHEARAAADNADVTNDNDAGVDEDDERV